MKSGLALKDSFKILLSPLCFKGYVIYVSMQDVEVNCIKNVDKLVICLNILYQSFGLMVAQVHHQFSFWCTNFSTNCSFYYPFIVLAAVLFLQPKALQQSECFKSQQKCGGFCVSMCISNLFGDEYIYFGLGGHPILIRRLNG